MSGKVLKVSGSLVVAENMQDAKLFDVVKISNKLLVGEIVEIKDDKVSIQVYENTTGLKVGDDVISTNQPLSMELGPGLLGQVFDGIGRSLLSIYQSFGDRILGGIEAPTLDHQKKWEFVPFVKKGQIVSSGDVLGYVQETELVQTKILVPFGLCGKVAKIEKGFFNIDESIAQIEMNSKKVDVSMCQKWPIRIARPVEKKVFLSTPLITGQRVLDTLFPVAKGGVAAVPGPFGSGKTVVQHQIAKWSDADVVVYVGCGERGNEMTEVLKEFPTLLDTRTGKNLMQKTILVANTSDMPVAAREASIYTGITIAEFFRDMGLDVVLMADSTSRWAEALREMSGRLEEMPGEEGYPAYLSSRLASFYERAGKMQLLGAEKRVGSVTVVGAVSPQGGDLSEPVSQATMRIVKTFWGLSSSLAQKRHFPSIDWLLSYSGYTKQLENWFTENVDYEFFKRRDFLIKTLQEETELNDIVSLVGFDVLGDKDKLTLEIARMIREDFLQQNAFDEVDTYSSIEKQSKMLKCLHTFSILAKQAIEDGISFDLISKLNVKEKIAKMKFCEEQKLADVDDIIEKLKFEFAELKQKEEQDD